ncbi:hypothetical protein PM082_016716 [Marasmius tenuissimus]|nr:hypothetical protein PM082_016716 [Marasmius tenuissimus]
MSNVSPAGYPINLRLELGDCTSQNPTFTANDLRPFRAFLPNKIISDAANEEIAGTVEDLGDLETSCREWPQLAEVGKTFCPPLDNETIHVILKGGVPTDMYNPTGTRTGFEPDNEGLTVNGDPWACSNSRICSTVQNAEPKILDNFMDPLGRLSRLRPTRLLLEPYGHQLTYLCIVAGLCGFRDRSEKRNGLARILEKVPRLQHLVVSSSNVNDPIPGAHLILKHLDV